jgi:hypothetical protein
MTLTTFHTFGPARRDGSSAAGAPLRLRLRVYVARGRLDRQIAAGCAYESTAALALRARQLIQLCSRQRLAHDLRGVDFVGRVGWRPVVIDALLGAGGEAIMGLAARLAGWGTVSPKGVVLARYLLTDEVNSPLFNPSCERTVVGAVWDIVDALGPDAPRTGFDVVAG